MRGCDVSVSAAEVDEGTWSANGDLMDTIGSSLGVTSELVSRRRRNTLFPLIALRKRSTWWFDRGYWVQGNFLVEQKFDANGDKVSGDRDGGEVGQEEGAELSVLELRQAMAAEVLELQAASRLVYAKLNRLAKKSGGSTH